MNPNSGVIETLEIAEAGSDTATLPDSSELAAYYANKPLMWRNVVLIGICTIGWELVSKLTVPLITLKLLDLGIGENIQATIGSVNLWMLSFLVIWFSWMSDRTISRIGRRKPYLFLAAPFIIVPLAIFPFFAIAKWVWFLVGLQIIAMIAMDLKSSTFPLLSIDCVPKEMLARANSVMGIVGGLMGFLVMRNAENLIKISDWFPFVFGGGVMTITTMAAYFIEEPPIRYPATEGFKIWSTFKVAAQDKRIFWLMAGVALINGYIVMNFAWLWFWANETLGLDRGDIFSALSWVNLVNIALAYPVAWTIDRFGGFRVVIFYWVGQLACFIWNLHVHDRNSLIILSLATAIIAPLYNAADIMIYKSAPRKDIGSYTATNSCLRNGYNATLLLSAGWIVHWTGSNFLVGFSLGMAMSTLGLLMFCVHDRLMNEKRTVANPNVSSLLI